MYAVTGNHEFMQNSLQEIQEFYKGTNIHLLLDEEVIINDQLRVVGRIDYRGCLLYTSPSPRDLLRSRMPSSA